MITTLSPSDSLIGSLCREVEYARFRCANIIQSLGSTRDHNLLIRLKSEFNVLEGRRMEVLDTATSLKKTSLSNSLSINFLIEICRRPLPI